MSDRETLRAMLSRAGVVYHEGDDVAGGQEDVLAVRAKDGPKNRGYADFVTYWRFAEDGSLDSVEVWE